MTDEDVYRLYPKQRKWFNKLWVSEQLGYYCGPSGIAPEIEGWYVVRPVMNIVGMSVGAKKVYIEKNDVSATPPGYFWCEWFDGTQYSVTYHRADPWKQVSCWRAERDEDDLSRFKKWERCKDRVFSLPSIFNGVEETNVLNIEFIDDRPIEVHLRESPDPDYNELIPVWKDDEKVVDIYKKIGYKYIKNFDDAGGFLKVPRSGFMVK